MAPPFRLAHLSDPHLPVPPGCEVRGVKPTLAALAWRRKRAVHRPEALAAIAADVAAWAPDHVAVTGDLVNLGAPEEFAAAAAWLDGWGPPRDLTVVPGNHEALTRAATSRWGTWAPWMGDAPGPFPTLRLRAGVALVGVSSAVATPPGSARGRIGADQLARLETMLVQAGAQGRTRVVLVHHPALPGAPWRKALADRAQLADVLARAGAELVLHGHLHRARLGLLPGPSGPIPVLGAPSASSVRGGGGAARWHALTLTTDAHGVEIAVRVRGLQPDGSVGALGGYTLRPGVPARVDEGGRVRPLTQAA